MNYKEVFQLAEQKGFRSHIESIDYGAIPDSELLSLLHLTQIQKWLRDDYKLFVQVILTTPHDLRVSVIGEGMEVHYSTLKYSVEQYHEASLEGTYQALKLLS